MPEALRAEHRQRRRDAVQDALYVDVDHGVPIIDAQLVERGDRPDAGVVDQRVELAEPLAGQRDQGGQVLAPPHVRARAGRLATGRHDAAGKGLEAIHPARAEHELRAPPGEQQRRRRADPPARARDGDDLAFDSLT